MSHENGERMSGTETGRSKRRLIGIVIALLVIALITALVVLVVLDIGQRSGY
jgi:hypothetical protein